jgi:hypothetical protein
MEARTEYLENRVKQLSEEVAGYKELVQSYEGILAALIKGVGGEATIKAEDVKASIEAREKLMYQYDADNQTYTMMAVAE